MKLKLLLLKLIKYIPSYYIKNFFYREVLGYSIGKNVRIGKAIINCKKVHIGNNVFIANNNVFSCSEVFIGNDTKIHSGNKFIGSSNFSIGNNSRVINNHYFDLWHNIQIGNNTWIAGKDSQFWTHGSLNTKTRNKDLSISIGDDNYISSSCLFAPGVIISDVNLIGLGSVVTKQFEDKLTIIAGNPAIIVKHNIDWRINW